MNKVLIVALAVCLVSVHAFVKREADEKENNVMKDLEKQAKEFVDKIKDALKPENVKKLQEQQQFLNNFTKMFEDLLPSTEKKE